LKTTSKRNVFEASIYFFTSDLCILTNLFNPRVGKKSTLCASVFLSRRLAHG
jgi:hypothetical protein